MALSRRGTHSKEIPGEMLAFACRYVHNPYDEHTNPKGIINLGMAENQLCEDMWTKKFNEDKMTEYTPDMQYYTEWRGSKKFRTLLAEFLTEQFKSHVPLDANNITCTSGAGGALDLIAHAFMDPGDCILTLAPIYSVISNDFGNRSEVNIHCIQLPGRKSPGENAFIFNRQLLEEGLKEAKEKGERVKGLILINPNNPTGDIYDLDTLKMALEFCHEHDLHIILDEIYGLSVWDESSRFHSVLSLESIPDPNKTHFVWSFSKDLGLSGFRCGVIHSLNPEFVPSTERVCSLAIVPNHTQALLGRVLQDKDWLNKVFFPTNLSMIRETYHVVRRWCEKMGVYVHPGTKAGYFIWADFSPYLRDSSSESEMALCEDMFSAGVYIVPGSAMYSRDPGWFRITFTMHRHLLEKGLERVESVLMKHKAT